MKIEVVNSKVFQLDDVSYSRGDFTIEYSNQAVRFKNKNTEVYIDKKFTDWEQFRDSNGAKYANFDTFTNAVIGIISEATPEGTITSDRGTVTQLTSITTGVVLNNLNGIVTTVASTLAADASANFTVTNNKVTASSNVIPNVIYAGAGNAEAKIVSVADGSFVVKLTNTGTAALNAAVKVGFIVL